MFDVRKGCGRLLKLRSAIVVGATGLVGSSLIKQLCENDEYVSVTAISRRPLQYSHPKLTVKVCPFDEIEEKDIEFANDFFCCLGTTMKKAKTKEQFEMVDFHYPMNFASLAKKRGIEHFIVITAMGSKTNSLFYYNRVKGKLEEQIKNIGLNQISIVRPSLIVGHRDEFRFGEKIGEIVLKILNPILIGPLKKYRSIEASQIALAMIVIALYGKKSPFTIYKSNQLLDMKLPEPVEEEEEITFNWDKFKEEEPEPIDEEVEFNLDKLKLEPINEEVTPLDEEVVFQRKKYKIDKEEENDFQQ